MSKDTYSSFFTFDSFLCLEASFTKLIGKLYEAGFCSTQENLPRSPLLLHDGQSPLIHRKVHEILL